MVSAADRDRGADELAMNSHAKRAAIRAVYAQVSAPDWADPNLDGLIDVLRDLSWLPDGDVTVTVPGLDALDEDDRADLLAVLRRAEADSAGSRHRLRLAMPHT
jgi:hypothetical protein